MGNFSAVTSRHSWKNWGQKRVKITEEAHNVNGTTSRTLEQEQQQQQR